MCDPMTAITAAVSGFSALNQANAAKDSARDAERERQRQQQEIEKQQKEEERKKKLASQDPRSHKQNRERIGAGDLRVNESSGDGIRIPT